MTERVLLAVDDSPQSQRAVEYVGRLLGGSSAYVYLVHVLPPVPVPLIEPPERAGVGTGGSSPKLDRWLEKAKAKGRQAMTAAADALVAAGFDAEHVEHGFLGVPAEANAVAALLDVASDNDCATVAVGRSTLPWHLELFHHHFADDLVKQAEGYTIWVVE